MYFSQQGLRVDNDTLMDEKRMNFSCFSNSANWFGNTRFTLCIIVRCAKLLSEVRFTKYKVSLIGYYLLLLSTNILSLCIFWDDVCISGRIRFQCYYILKILGDICAFCFFFTFGNIQEYQECKPDKLGCNRILSKRIHK